MFALITPAEIDQSWVDVVVPHELVHLVFATATDNPYNDPPHWLNEGLAVYLSEGYTRDYRNDGRKGGRRRDDHPARGPGRRVSHDVRALPARLRGEHLGGRLHRHAPTTAMRSLASSAHTRPGVSDDEAFKAALGVDMAGFEAEWLASLGATAPVRHGPQPAPPGPVPEGWSGSAPNPSVAPGTGSGSSQTPNRPPSDSPAAGSDSGLLLAAIAAIVVIGVGLALFARRRTARPGP